MTTPTPSTWTPAHEDRGLDLVPRPLLDPRECWHIYIDAQRGPTDVCSRCGVSVKWVQDGRGGWRAVIADDGR